jgi:hypothetical protein
MMRDKAVLSLAFLLATIACSRVATAQYSRPTATQVIQLSAFEGVSGVYTGLSGSRNLSLTVGADLAFSPWHGTLPTLEFRGTLPIDKGKIVSQKDVLGGLRLDLLLGSRLHPYGDFLFGRGEMNYASPGYLFNNYSYLVTTTYIYSPGTGFDYDLSNHFAIKVDGQVQRWSNAPTASGNIYSTIGTISLVYHVGWLGMP